MPAETLSPPTSAPAAPAAPSAPAQPTSSGTTTPSIQVTPAAIDKGPAPEPPKKGSARQQMFDELRKKAGVAPETKPETKPVAEAEEAPEPGKESAPPVEGEKPKGKISPWKLVDEHKAARLKAEQELVELRKTMADPAKVKEIETKAEAAERRAKELEEEIRYVNYSKSEEFKTKYQQPYEDAWKRWMGELGELTVADQNGTERPLAPQDILELVNMPLAKARERAEETFGSFANDVMTARKEIRGLFEAQNRALEEARKAGSARDEQRQKLVKEYNEALSKEIGEVWTKANQEAVADEKVGRYFKPIEGDEEGNKRLAKGYEMADKAFTVNPTNPNLTAEERANIVRLHAAVRNRAAAFGRAMYQNQMLEAKVAALTEELNKYKSAEPGAGTPKPDKPAGQMSARDSVFAALRARAH